MMKIRFDLYTIQRHQRAQQNKNLYSLVFETVAHFARDGITTLHIHKKTRRTAQSSGDSTPASSPNRSEKVGGLKAAAPALSIASLLNVGKPWTIGSSGPFGVRTARGARGVGVCLGRVPERGVDFVRADVSPARSTDTGGGRSASDRLKRAELRGDSASTRGDAFLEFFLLLSRTSAMGSGGGVGRRDGGGDEHAERCDSRSVSRFSQSSKRDRKSGTASLRGDGAASPIGRPRGPRAEVCSVSEDRPTASGLASGAGVAIERSCCGGALIFTSNLCREQIS